MNKTKLDEGVLLTPLPVKLDMEEEITGITSGAQIFPLSAYSDSILIKSEAAKLDTI